MKVTCVLAGESLKPGYVMLTCQESWNGTDQEDGGKNFSWTIPITGRSRNQTDKECCRETYDVRVGHIDRGHVDIFGDDVGQKRWKCVP